MSYIEALGSAPAPVRDLQVKSYPPKGWASYQSPSSNDVLRGLQRELNRFGSGLAVDGVIGSSTVSAVKRVAEQFRQSSYGNIATSLAFIAEGGAERVATKGEYARYFVSLLADKYAAGSGPTAEQVATAERLQTPKPGSGGISPPIIAQPPGSPPYTTSASPGIGEMGPVGKVIMGAGLVVTGALILKQMRKGKRGKR